MKRPKNQPFQCPSCRASVRETRPNATVTTLLDMYLKANPGKERSAEEKNALFQAYKPGDTVLPKFRKRKQTPEEVAEQRMIEQTTELSLREAGIRGNMPESRSTQAVTPSIREERSTTEARVDSSTPSRIVSNASRASQIGHQNSLRSILSSSDLGDAADIEEEILKSIMEDGILDGIDLNHLSVAQEEDLTERIADAYRRRHRRRRSRSRDQISPPSASRSQPRNPAAEQRRERRQGRSSQSSETPSSPNNTEHRPRLLDPGYPTEQGHSRRTSSEHRRQTSPTLSSNSHQSTDTQRKAARSATDLSSNSQPSQSSPSHLERPDQARSRTDSKHLHQRSTHRDKSSRSSRSPARPQHRSSNTTPSVPSESLLSQVNRVPNSPGKSAFESVTSQVNSSAQSPSSMYTSPTMTDHPTTPLRLYDEPSIDCRRCGKPNLEYELHWNCPICADGDFNLCQHCYRTGKGCLHWFGFGPGSLHRYQRQAPSEGYPTDHEPPHHLQGQRYMRPADSFYNTKTSSDPSTRLQAGPFCSICSTFSPTYYWQCDFCNEGEWGFCNNCVNQGRCCTHALLPVAVTSYLKSPPSSPAPPDSATETPPYRSNKRTQDYFTSLSISTHCDQCRQPIPPDTTRYHCPTCNNGDFDLCTACYVKLLRRGTIAPDDGPNGWRKCPNGHRMIIIGFEDSSQGRRRIVLEDLVGGHALNESDTTLTSSNSRSSSQEEQGGPGWRWQGGTKQMNSASRSTTMVQSPQGAEKASGSQSAGNEGKAFPPSGGVGMRVQALWGYWPQDGVKDELGFPRGAEITECDDINGDWYWGIYCSQKGLFPGGYGRVIGRVGV